MGTYTYTLRTKTQNVELPGGEIAQANLLGYLCRSNDHDTFMHPGDYGYRTAMALNAQIEACQQRWWRKGPVYVIEADAKQGYRVYRAEDAEKAAVWFDCDRYEDTEGVTLVGRVGHRVRRGRRLVWTIMTEAEAAAFDWGEEEAQRQAAARREREATNARIRARVEALNERKAAEAAASLDSSGL